MNLRIELFHAARKSHKVTLYCKKETLFMKKHCVTFLASASLVVSLLASFPLQAFGEPVSRPLLVRSNFPGFVPSWHAVRSVCRVFQNRLEIERGFGHSDGVSIIERRALALSAQSIQRLQKLIIDSRQGPFETRPSNIADVPTSRYVAFLYQPESTRAVEIVLKDTGMTLVDNQSEAGRQLTIMLDALCGARP